MSHIAKVTAMQHAISQGDSNANDRIDGKRTDVDGLQATLNTIIKPNAAKQVNAESGLTDASKTHMRRYEHIQNIDQLQVSLVKNYYSLRLLKQREYKQKLLSTVNYFRAVQRLLALDLKEHVTREKGVGEKSDVIEPHFGKDGDGKNLSKQAP